MSLDFSDLELLAQQQIDFSPTEALAAEVHHYQNATLEELAELLEERVESYTLLLPTLPVPLQRSARQEIEFFAALFQERIESLLGQTNPRYYYRHAQAA